MVYTAGESKDSNCVIASLDTGTVISSGASATHDIINHSNVGQDVNTTESDCSEGFSNKSNVRHMIGNSSNPNFQSFRPAPIESSCRKALHQIQSDNGADMQPANSRAGSKKGTTVHQCSGTIAAPCLDGAGYVNMVPHTDCGSGGGDNDTETIDQVGNVHLFFHKQQQEVGEGSEQIVVPAESQLCSTNPGNNTLHQILKRTDEHAAELYPAEPLECGHVKHDTNTPPWVNTPTGKLHGATTESGTPRLSPSSLTTSPQDVPFLATTGDLLPHTTCLSKAAGFPDVGHTAAERSAGEQQIRASSQAIASKHSTKQIPPVTSQDTVCVIKTKEQSLPGCKDALVVEPNQHDVADLSNTETRAAAGFNDFHRTECDDSAPLQRTNDTGGTVLETAANCVFINSKSWEYSGAYLSPTSKTCGCKQAMGQVDNTFTAPTNVSACKLEECEQPNTCSRPKKCFDHDQASLFLPRGGSNSFDVIDQMPGGIPPDRLTSPQLPQTIPQIGLITDKP